MVSLPLSDGMSSQVKAEQQPSETEKYKFSKMVGSFAFIAVST